MPDFAALLHRILDRLEGQHGKDEELDEMRRMLPEREGAERDGYGSDTPGPDAREPDSTQEPKTLAAPPPHPDLPQGPALTGGLGLTNEEHLASLGPNSGAALPHEADGEAVEAQEAVPATPPAAEPEEAAHEAPAPAGDHVVTEGGEPVETEDGHSVVVAHEEQGE